MKGFLNTDSVYNIYAHKIPLYMSSKSTDQEKTLRSGLVPWKESVRQILCTIYMHRIYPLQDKRTQCFLKKLAEVWSCTIKGFRNTESVYTIYICTGLVSYHKKDSLKLILYTIYMQYAQKIPFTGLENTVFPEKWAKVWSHTMKGFRNTDSVYKICTQDTWYKIQHTRYMGWGLVSYYERIL